MASPTTSAMDAVKRIMAYLKGAKDWCLGVPLTSPNGGVSTGSDSMGVVSSLADAQAKGAKAICHHSQATCHHSSKGGAICHDRAKGGPWQFFCDSEFAGNQGVGFQLRFPGLLPGLAQCALVLPWLCC